MEPDLFRLNVNQFLQTSRTVTFIIQKNKDAIPDFATWYPTAVQEPWRSDDVMRWSIDARNTIEKQGDLELHSSLDLTLLFSYLSERDITVDVGRSELLHAGTKKLIRLARRRLPTGVGDAAVVKIERRWITATLPQWELLRAMKYVYARMYACCRDLAKHLGATLEPTVPDPERFDEMRDAARQVRYLKLSSLNTHSIVAEQVPFDPTYAPPAEIKEAFNAATSQGEDGFEGTLTYLSKMAEMTFLHYGNHVPMLFLYDEDWNPIDMVSTHFSDQADKFIFWRSIGERVADLRASALSWISESWRREMGPDSTVAIRNLPIIGEQLHVVLLDKSGRIEKVDWTIVRDTQDSKPTLQRLDAVELSKEAPYYLAPAMRAMGLPDPPTFYQTRAG